VGVARRWRKLRRPMVGDCSDSPIVSPSVSPCNVEHFFERRWLMSRVRQFTFLALLTTVVLGLIASPAAMAQTSSDLVPFTGRWTGQLSGLPLTLDIFENEGLLNATAWINGTKQNFEYLGFKPSFVGHYFWREGDKAAVCLYFEAGGLVMTYFEKDNLRKVSLQRQ
jgi:hypothetical protein